MGIRRITGIVDAMRAIEVFELDDGRRVSFSQRTLSLYGLLAMLRSAGIEDDEERRLPVFQDGIMVGTLPDRFDPKFSAARTLLYDPRPGDFVRQGGRWLADPSLGLGDLDAVPEFRIA